MITSFSIRAERWPDTRHKQLRRMADCFEAQRSDPTLSRRTITRSHTPAGSAHRQKGLFSLAMAIGTERMRGSQCQELMSVTVPAQAMIARERTVVRPPETAGSVFSFLDSRGGERSALILTSHRRARRLLMWESLVGGLARMTARPSRGPRTEKTCPPGM